MFAPLLLKLARCSELFGALRQATHLNIDRGDNVLLVLGMNRERLVPVIAER